MASNRVSSLGRPGEWSPPQVIFGYGWPSAAPPPPYELACLWAAAGAGGEGTLCSGRASLICGMQLCVAACFEREDEHATDRVKKL